MEKKVLKIFHSPANPHVEVTCGVALTIVPPYSPQRVTVHVARRRTDSFESHLGMRTRQLPDAVTVTLDPAFKPESTMIFDDWKVTLRLLSLGEEGAEPGSRAYEFHVIGAQLSKE